MPRIACAHVPALPLQLLLVRHPEWAGRPAAVVDRDSPQGKILWINARARQRRILPGLRYAAALALDGDLVAGTVADRETESAVEELTRRLLVLTPGVEPAEGEPGVFFLDASGFDRLWPSLVDWAEAVRAAIERPPTDEILEAPGAAAYRAVTVVVGFTRFGTYAVARAAPGLMSTNGGRRVALFADPRAERSAAGRVPLARLGVDPELRDALGRLGVATVDDLRRLPEGGLAERFGGEALRLHRLASDALREPLTPERPRAPLGASAELESPDDDAARLLFLAKRLLDPLLAELDRRGEALASLAFTLRLEDGTRRRETLAPARPTRDGAQLLELVRLRLEGVELPGRVEEVRLEAESVAPAAGQIELFPAHGRRDPEAAARALARLRAELGDAAVVRARPADRWLPEGAFLWEPIARLLPPAPPVTTDAAPPRLVRRILARPRPLPSRPRGPRDRDADDKAPSPFGTDPSGPTPSLVGPYRLSGGWWRGGAHRDYYFAETERGELLWIYLDRERKRWFLQGTVA